MKGKYTVQKLLYLVEGVDNELLPGHEAAVVIVGLDADPRHGFR
jgi:hypothetical protein